MTRVFVPNLVLIGFMASGKSTIGRRCAHALDFKFRDSDTFVERRTGKTVAEVFAEQGEAAFRALEVEAIEWLSGRQGLVIATGGGAPMNPVNVQNLRRSGVILFLTAEVEEILRRVGNRQNRPLIADAEDPKARVEALLAQRLPVYLAAADSVIDTTGISLEEVAEAALKAYREGVERFSGRERR